jgi:hypothetical protein
MDESDTILKNEKETDKQVKLVHDKGKAYHTNFNASNIFSAFWIRCLIRSNNEMDRFLLDYGFNFLLYFGSILWLLFLLIS